MPSPARDDVIMKPSDNETMAQVGESSQPDDAQQSRQPRHQQILTDNSAAFSATSSANGMIGSANPVRSSLPQAMPDEDFDGNSFGSASGTSSVSIPIHIQSSSLNAHYPITSLHSADRRPSGASSTSSQANSFGFARADSTDSAPRPPPRPLDVTRSVRNGASTSPMPLYSQQLFGQQQLCYPSPGDSNSEEGDFIEQEYQPDFAQMLSSMKRKRPHPKEEEQDPSVAPDVVAATQDVIALLQMYGPLSYVQLKVNIETQFEGEEESNLPSKLQTVLDILVELGVIHVLEHNSATASSPADGSKPDKSDNPVYSFGCGARRMDSVLPFTALDEINDAGNEIIQTQQRIELLQSFLHGARNTKKPSATGRNPASLTQEFARKSLRTMMEQHPDVVHDPTYAAALRLFKIHDVNQNNKGALPMEGGGSGSKKRKRPKSNDNNAIDTIAKDRTGSESPLIDSKSNEL